MYDGVESSVELSLLDDQEIMVLSCADQQLFHKVSMRANNNQKNPLVVMTKELLILCHNLKRMPLSERSILSPPSFKGITSFNDPALKIIVGRAEKNHFKRKQLEMVTADMQPALWKSKAIQSRMLIFHNHVPVDAKG